MKATSQVRYRNLIIAVCSGWVAGKGWPHGGRWYITAEAGDVPSCPPGMGHHATLAQAKISLDETLEAAARFRAAQPTGGQHEA